MLDRNTTTASACIGDDRSRLTLEETTQILAAQLPSVDNVRNQLAGRAASFSMRRNYCRRHRRQAHLANFKAMDAKAKTCQTPEPTLTRAEVRLVPDALPP